MFTRRFRVLEDWRTGWLSQLSKVRLKDFKEGDMLSEDDSATRIREWNREDSDFMERSNYGLSEKSISLRRVGF